MNAEKLLQLTQNPQEVTLEDVEALKALLQQYPYFQNAYTLIAKAVYDADHPQINEQIQQAAVYATDRDHLKALLEAEPHAPEKPAPVYVPTTEKTISKPEPQDFINGYINNIHKKAEKKITKQKSLDQLNIMQAFIRKNVHLQPGSLQASSVESYEADLSKESTILHDDLFTERLAQIMNAQGKTNRSIEIYNKLMLKFPDKTAYFTAQIEDLKNKA